MKKIIILLLIGTGMLNAMEQQLGLRELPHEIQSHIVSYVPRAGSFEDIINLMRVDKQFQNLVTNPIFFKEFISRSGLDNPETLEEIVQTAARKGSEQPLALAFARLLINEHPKLANNLMVESIILRNSKLLDLLLAAGISPNSRDLTSPQWGWTVLDRAVMSQYLAGMQKLLSKGADPDMPDNYERTPLMHAAESANKDIVQLLLNHGADASTQTKDGATALNLAQVYRMPDLNKLLKDAVEGTSSNS